MVSLETLCKILISHGAGPRRPRRSKGTGVFPSESHPLSGKPAPAFRDYRGQGLFLLEPAAGRPPPLFSLKPLLLDSSQLARFPVQLLLLREHSHTNHSQQALLSCASRGGRSTGTTQRELLSIFSVVRPQDRTECAQARHENGRANRKVTATYLLKMRVR